MWLLGMIQDNETIKINWLFDEKMYDFLTMNNSLYFGNTAITAKNLLKIGFSEEYKLKIQKKLLKERKIVLNGLKSMF